MAENKTAKATGKALTKSAIYMELAEETQLSRKQVSEVFDALGNMIKRELSKKGAGVFTMPGSLLKIKRVSRPATKSRMGRNPANGEPMMIKAKPARTVVKAQALKTLKEMVK
jgi:nucleoid DNA-binding protein